MQFPNILNNVKRGKKEGKEEESQKGRMMK